MAAPRPATTPQADTAARARVGGAYGQLPLRFEANRGQADHSVKFVSRGQGYTLFLTPTEAVLRLRNDAEAGGVEGQAAGLQTASATGARAETPEGLLRIGLVGGNPEPRVRGRGRLPGRSNYFVGSDKRAWRTNVPNYEGVEYKAVYPGVDLVYYGNQRQLEYDFRLAPRADARRIRLTYSGAESMTVDEHGDLVLRTAGGEVRQRKPFAYQEVGGVRREVAARYTLDERRRQVGFELGAYDARRPLVIDPVLLYSTYLGGSGFDRGLGIAVGSDGSAYVTGDTVSADFPGPSPRPNPDTDYLDAFVSKLNPAGTAIVYTTYLGGKFDDGLPSISVDGAGNAYVVGITASDDFPRTPGSLQQTFSGESDGFVTKISPSGSALVYSTLLGGAGEEEVLGIDVDTSGNAYIVGRTTSRGIASAGLLDARAGSPVYKSTDGGAGWAESDNGLTSNRVDDFTFDPTNPSTIYAATPHGVFKSTDGGNLWALTGTTAQSAKPLFVESIAVDPSNPHNVYVAAGDGLYRSTNGGASYERKASTSPLFAVVIDPTTPTTIYAGGFFGVYKSTNGGDTWSHLDLDPRDEPDVTDLAIDPTNPSKLYAVTREHGVFRTTNGGANWTRSGPSISGTAIVINPVTPTTIYASFIAGGVYKSTDGGATWVVSNSGLTATVNGQTVFPRVEALAIDPANPSIIYAGTNAGVFKSTDGAANWAAASVGLDNRIIMGLAVDPSAPANVWAGANALADTFVGKINAGGSGLVYFRYLGGNENDVGGDIAVDGGGNAYVTGLTTSSNFPVASAIQPSYGGATDAFVTKINPTGAALVYSTYLGGAAFDEAQAIAVGPGGTAHVTGRTGSTNFPLANALRGSLGAQSFGDAFVTKINAGGTALDYSTFLGGDTSTELSFGIAVDTDGSAVITGQTNSIDFPVVAPVQAGRGGSSEAFVSKLNPAGTALVYSTYLGGAGSDQGNAIALDTAGNAYVVGTTASPNFPVSNALQGAFSGVSDAFVAKIGVPSSAVRFDSAVATAHESAGALTVNVTRTGDASGAASVAYATAGGTANERQDYTPAQGTLHFAPGETTRSFKVILTNDARVEGAESFNVTLSNPVGVVLDSPQTMVVEIRDDDTDPNAPNPIDDARFFVRQHYADFLNREPDEAGLNFWSGQITVCGTDAGCIDNRRQHVSAAFFLSIEFQQTGYLVYRTYGAAFGTRRVGATVPLTLQEFLPDTQRIGLGVVVNAPGWEQQLEQNKQAYLEAFVARPQFLSLYPQTLTPGQFVDALNANTGGSLSPAERDSLVNDLATGARTRAQVLRSVAEDSDFDARERNRAFVLMQYFGYLRRNPNDAPELNLDFSGYNFWLGKLNQFGGDFVAAEMVRSFLVSGEYRGRFK